MKIILFCLIWGMACGLLGQVRPQRRHVHVQTLKMPKLHMSKLRSHGHVTRRPMGIKWTW